MSETKVYRVVGKVRKPNFKTNFQKEIRATRPEDAVESVYKILGSKHRVKRFYIEIEGVEEVSEEKAEEA